MLSTDDEMDNFADFGKPVASRSTGDSFTVKLNKKNDQWWTVHLNGFQFGDTDLMSGDVEYAIVDTGTSLMYMF